MDDAVSVRAVLERRWSIGTRVRVRHTMHGEPSWLRGALGVVVEPTYNDGFDHTVRIDVDGGQYVFSFDELEECTDAV